MIPRGIEGYVSVAAAPLLLRLEVYSVSEVLEQALYSVDLLDVLEVLEIFLAMRLISLTDSKCAPFSSQKWNLIEVWKL